MSARYSRDLELDVNRGFRVLSPWFHPQAHCLTMQTMRRKKYVVGIAHRNF